MFRIHCKNCLLVEGVAVFLLLGAVFCALAATASAQVSAQDEWCDNPEDTLDIEWMGPVGFAHARPDSWIQRSLEDRYNIRFKPKFLDSVAYSKTRALHFVAGEIPDVFWDGDPIGVRSKARHGFVLDLPYEIILRHAPNYVAYVNQHGPEAWMYSRWRGRNWGLPTVVPSGSMPLVYVWREDWLENVGLFKVPETIEEAHEAFRRFTFNDPDGNGKRDTYGLSPSMIHWSHFFAEFFAARGVLPFDLQEVNGKITWGGIRPEAREVLAILRNWYAEGIIAPDFVLCRTSDQHEAPFVNGRVGYFGPGQYGSLFNADAASSLIKRMARTQPQARLAAGAPLKDAGGTPRGRVWGGGGHVLQFSSKIPKQKVIRVLRFLDDVYADATLTVEAIMGRRGMHWDYSPQKGAYLLAPYNSQDDRRAEHEMLSAANLRNYGFFAPSGLPLNVQDSYGSDSQREAMGRFARPEWGISNALGKTDTLENTSSTLADLRRLQEKYYVDIIRGTLPLESFERFVGLWLERGGDKLLEEAQTFKLQRDEVYRQVSVKPGEDTP